MLVHFLRQRLEVHTRNMSSKRTSAYPNIDAITGPPGTGKDGDSPMKENIAQFNAMLLNPSVNALYSVNNIP